MRIHISPRKRAFTVLGNEVLRDRRLSFTARGILGYLLSLPDGSREDVRTLADKHPGVGRRGVAKAVDELVRYGYYLRRTVRDPETGHVRTETFVSDTPQSEAWPHPDQAAPHPAPGNDPALTPESDPDQDPGTGEREDGETGASPLGTKTTGEEPSLPEPVKLTAASGRGASLLARLATYEPRLALSVNETLVLAPLAEQWLAHGVSELEARSLLTDGLPRFVYSARALLADRLGRKLPAPRIRKDPAAPAAPPAECGFCHDPLPTPDTPCRSCAGPRTAPSTALPTPAEVATLADIARRALRGMPALA
ncbi:helix-turn-helix domain-containing protein [Streptomyces sp. ISL-43]|uniref:helix-turn-helix domain-containing protein n=1 Tax=Streptomyces sp. ISL-43 TaxID=2819183 RepID=UPI001BEB583B|nr:helix-turn-helix domain-containing protein [Streptomyces sp. ISL-43]MBT2446838.1 helix-turn-helix domain-containing protein [Streptomyces sp. ISL-43]